MNFPDSPEIQGLFESSVALTPLMDELPIGMVIIDKDQRVMFLNKAFESLTGFSLEDVWGVPCRHVMRNSLCHQNCPVVRESDISQPVRFECDIINRERKKISVRVSSGQIRDRNDRLVGFVEMVRRYIRSKQRHLQASTKSRIWAASRPQPQDGRSVQDHTGYCPDRFFSTYYWRNRYREGYIG